MEAASGLVWKEKEEALGELHQLTIMTIFGGSQGNQTAAMIMAGWERRAQCHLQVLALFKARRSASAGEGQIG